ncbi:MAG TPA: CopG family antitoxin [Candidatus Dormibacteraeota bacterium]|nr:CopG family antitoxin [Candidatus Dormibacteraeota bacterium]
MANDDKERREAVAAFSAMSDGETEAWLDQEDAEAKRRGVRPQRLGERALEMDRTVPISMRLPSQLLARIKAEADHLDMPYQRLMRELLEAGLSSRGERPIAEAFRTAILDLKVGDLLQSTDFDRREIAAVMAEVAEELQRWKADLTLRQRRTTAHCGVAQSEPGRHPRQN